MFSSIPRVEQGFHTRLQKEEEVNQAKKTKGQAHLGFELWVIICHLWTYGCLFFPASLLHELFFLVFFLCFTELPFLLQSAWVLVKRSSLVCESQNPRGESMRKRTQIGRRTVSVGDWRPGSCNFYHGWVQEPNRMTNPKFLHVFTEEVDQRWRGWLVNRELKGRSFAFRHPLVRTLTCFFCDSAE